MAKKILIPIDDSENALRAVAFVSSSFARDNQVTLLNVMIDTATLCNMESPELIPLFKVQQATFCALEDKKRELVKDAMQQAKEALMAAGFSADNISIKIQDKQSGVARDILNEAEKGYDLIVIGRRGMSGIKEFFMGSISQKVLNGAKDISVLIVT
ncbi:MAG: universal stress protein [Desulfatitalea sp.]|nr:universal stress protein [Desulfatitalea sp.]